MKSYLLLLFSCIFALLPATAAQASDFTDNTCYQEGANCQTRSDWLTGWCEAAVAASVVDQSVDECAQAVGANQPDTQDASAQSAEFTGNTCYQEGANCQTQSDWLTGWCEAAVAAGVVDQSVDECAQAVGAAPAQNQNRQSSASSSRQSSGGGQGRGANQTKDTVTLTQSPNPNSSEQSSGGSQQQGSGNGDASDGRPVNCRAWIVRRSNPSLFNCFRVTRRGIGGEFLIDG